jgi:hypothetical protein
MSKKTGEVEWDDVNCKNGERKSIFLSMKEPGNYQVRIVSKPYQYFCHWIDMEDGSRRKVNCLDDGAHDGKCPVCVSTGKGPQFKWLLKVLFRTPQGSVLRLLDAGAQILGQIRDLHKDPEFGSVAKYDIKIIRGQRNANPLYRVLPLGSAKDPKPLTEEEKKIVKDSSEVGSESYVDMVKFCQPSTLEQINEVLGVKPKGKDEVVGDDFAASGGDEEDSEFLDL